MVETGLGVSIGFDRFRPVFSGFYWFRLVSTETGRDSFTLVETGCDWFRLV